MNELTVLTTFTGGLTAALLLGFLANRLRLSPIVGYLLAGIVVGPFTPGFVANKVVAEQFAEIGVILLLFGIGLKFQLKELAAVWRIAVPGAIFQSSFSTVALAALLRLLGWDWSSGIVLGLAISVASTVVMARVLSDQHDLHTPIGHKVIGWTVVEDLITVVILLLLPMIFGRSGGGDALAALGLAGLKIAGLVGVVLVLGRWVIPWALEKVAATRSQELFTLSILALAMGIAVAASVVFGVSMALGAFLAGLAVGRSEFAARAAGDALPMRDAFAVLFFVSVGMLFDAGSLLREPLTAAAVLLVVLVGKPLSAMLTILLLGRPGSTAFPVGAALAQIGEFSFILGSVALDLGIIDKTGWNAMVAASIISIAMNPSFYKWSRKFRIAESGEALETGDRPPIDPRRCILIGYGPVGRTVHRILDEGGANVNIIELNLETVRQLRADGRQVVYGDVLRPGTLEAAEIESAASLILSADLENGAEIVRRARSMNPELRILARCGYLREAAAFRSAGATVVAAGEAEVAVALAEAVTGVMDAGATAEQRAAVRGRLYR